MTTDFRNFRTIKQIASEKDSPFSEGSLRWLVFEADKNGFDECICRVNRRVLIDIERFNRYLDQRRAGPAPSDKTRFMICPKCGEEASHDSRKNAGEGRTLGQGGLNEARAAQRSRVEENR